MPQAEAIPNEFYRLNQRIAVYIKEIRETVGDKHVVIGISGGVDSLVAATLLHKAIGTRLHAVFVDHGLLRKGEVESVSKALRAREFDLHVIDASQTFLARLKGVTDPEQKRKIIGHTFIEVFEAAGRAPEGEKP